MEARLVDKDSVDLSPATLPRLNRRADVVLGTSWATTSSLRA